MNSRVFNTSPAEATDRKALDTFEAALRELRAPSKAVTAEAVREVFQSARAQASQAQSVADQYKAELSDAFHAFLVLHEDTSAFARLKADHARLLTLANKKRSGQ